VAYTKTNWQDGVTIVDAAKLNNLEDQTEKNQCLAGPEASKPTPSLDGLLYLATDTLRLYRANGATWDLVADADTVDGVHIPNTIANILTDHNKQAHDSLGIDAATLGGSLPSAFELAANKGAPNGYASLDASALLPLTQLPTIPPAKVEDSLGGPTFLVAPSNSVNKDKADYICDGTADEVEIQAAVDALPSTGGEVGLLDGQFNLSNPVTLKSKVHISGTGPATFFAHYSKLFYIPSTAEEVHLSEFSVHAFADTAMIEVYGKRVQMSKLDFLVEQSGEAPIVIESTAEDVILSTTTFKAAGWDSAWAAIDANGGTRILISNCLAKDILLLYAGSGTSKITVIGCDAIGGLDDWIINLSGSKHTILGNTLSDSPNAWAGVLSTASDTTIAFNTIMGVSGSGIVCKGDRNIILGNRLNTSADGIKIQGADYCIVQGNIITGCTGNGILVTPDATNHPTRNQVTGNIATGNSGYGVKIDANADYTRVRGNILIGNTLGPILDNGTGTVLGASTSNDNMVA